MRNTKACSVDVLVNCEGNVVIYKTYNITINHIKIPYVSADISNESIMVSYDKLKQQFIGLPATFEIRMWKGEEELPNVEITMRVNGLTTCHSMEFENEEDRDKAFDFIDEEQVKPLLENLKNIISDLSDGK